MRRMVVVELGGILFLEDTGRSIRYELVPGAEFIPLQPHDSDPRAFAEMLRREATRADLRARRAEAELALREARGPHALEVV